MPAIKLTNVSKRWGNFYGADHLNLDIPDNAFVTLLGPSGCGKTTTLRMIAGLETPTEGKIQIGDKVVFDSEEGINVPANKRKVGFLFQNYALWPNMTVYQNISFGLSNVKEMMPVISFETRVAKQKIEILKNPQAIKDMTLESIDKKGKLNKDKLLLKLIDTYTISMMTAKDLLALNLDKADDIDAVAQAEIARQENVIQLEIAKAFKNGSTIDEKDRYVKDGHLVMRNRKYCKEEIDLAVRRVSRIVKIGMFMDRYPAELSGGQQQRVAIARTLAPGPSVLFMDEPLSNLDAKLRLEMRLELQRLHVETGSTFVYVTHDQMEAMTLASAICLIDNGVVQQYDAPLTVYNYPKNTFVADFVGNPSINFVEAKAKQVGSTLDIDMFEGIKATFIPKDPSFNIDKFNRDDKAVDENLVADKVEQLKDKKNVEKGNADVRFKYHIAKVDETELDDDKVITDEDVVIGIRPEAIKIVDDGKIECEIYSAMPTGMETTIRVKIKDYLLTGVIFGGTTYEIGQKVRINIDSDGIMLFSMRSGRLETTGRLE